MKKIGLIGGLSWQSSKLYYEIINTKAQEILGGAHSAPCIMESVDFAAVEKLQRADNWAALNEIMIGLAKNLENAQAQVVVICASTMHLCSEAIAKNISIPLLHIAAATGAQVQAKKLKKVLLLGTRFTMERDFFKNIFKNHFNIETVVPSNEDRTTVHEVIYKELVCGVVRPQSKKAYQRIINTAAQNGAEGVVLGCTEIPLLIQSGDVDIPVFDTTKIHAEAAVEFALTP